jgi:short-subunit dehydrogenase
MTSGAGPRVFITGASSGIGAAFARAYAARGATLGLTARRTEKLRQVADSVAVPSAVYSLDVRDAAALRSAAADFIARFGAPDTVIANAGISVGTLTDLAEDLPVFREIIDTNVLGMVHTFHPFLAAMKEARRGSLVGIASIAAVRGLPGGGAYSASKAAAVRYLESLRVELRGTGIRVTTICPGFIRTEMTADNAYHMPFLIDADDAVQRMMRVIDAGRSQATVPWQMALVSTLLSHLPNTVYDALLARRPRKPRRGQKI